jgi:alkylation response protein AidB-like acyl-CoA dehydrogenase
MKLVHTPEQRDFMAALRDLFADACPPSLVRAIKAADSDGFPAPLWQALTQMGAFGLAIREELGGEGAGLYDLGLLFT